MNTVRNPSAMKGSRDDRVSDQCLRKMLTRVTRRRVPLGRRTPRSADTSRAKTGSRAASRAGTTIGGVGAAKL